MNGSKEATEPSSFSFIITTSPPSLVLRFQDPWRAMKMAFLYSGGNIAPV